MRSRPFAGAPSTPALRALRRPAPEEIAFTGSGTEVDNHALIRAAHACNIGGFFSALPSLALSGWLYIAGLLPGAWLGTKVVARLR
jgi:hypothetical protein